MAENRPDGMDEATQELYGLDPTDFVAARNDLAKRLRTAGDRALATEVGELRRPSPAAWAVNQLARHHRADLEELVRLGQVLQAAQEGALSGAEAGDLRQAGRARREAVSRMTGIAGALLDERGAGGAAHAAEVAATLEAASLDADAAAAVLAGRLTQDLRPPSGLGVFDPAEPVAPRPARPKPSKPDSGAARTEPDEADDGERTEAQAAAAEARRLWDQGSAAARAAVDEVVARRATVQEAEAEIARLEELVEAARRRLTAAVRDADQAEDAASRAEDAASKAAAELRDADRRLAGLDGR